MLSEVQYKGPVCRGSWALGNNCKICERCIATKPTNPRPPMTEITHEALEALSKKATQARRAYELEPNTSTLTAFMNAENEFAWALAALYRTGQLILAQPSGDEVEAVARKLAPFLEGGREYDQMPATRRELKIWNRNGMALINDATQDDAQEAATAAITALDAHRGKQACLKARENSDG